MNQSIGDDELDQQLRDAAPYIEDDGFTARVIHNLPARSAPARLRAIVLMVTATLASMLAYVLSGGGRFLHIFIAQILELPMSWLLALSFAAGMVVSCFALAAAVFNAREAQLTPR